MITVKLVCLYDSVFSYSIVVDRPCMFMHHIYFIFIFFDYFCVVKFELYHNFYNKSTKVSAYEKSNVDNSFLFNLDQAINTANSFSFFIWI